MAPFLQGVLAHSSMSNWHRCPLKPEMEAESCVPMLWMARPAGGAARRPLPVPGQVPCVRGAPHIPAGSPWGRLRGALNAGLRPAIESILFTSLEEQSL